jgi:hypothetical protein
MDGAMADRELRAMEAEKRLASLQRDRREGGMADQLERVLGLLGDLEDLAGVLADKLQPALTEELAEPAPPGVVRPQPVTQWSAHLENVGDRLQQLRGRLANLQQRVDL